MANYQVGNLELRIVSYAKTATASLGKMNTQLSKTGKAIKNTGIFASMGKWNYSLNMLRYYGRSLANIVQYAMDYVETQNLWQVANRNNLEMADEFISKLNKAYGISEQTLMNYQAIFKNMLSALGDLSDTVSSSLSLQLTQMALDFSSLYNVSIASAMTKFQQVLSGQVRPIRSVSGYDITETTIYDLYTKMGGEKSVRQLSQLEKRLLRIYAVFTQMGTTGALGDFSKTIETAANQSRIMSEQGKEMLTWIGQSILLFLNEAKVLQYVNALLMTMKEIFKSIAYSLGYENQDFLSGMLETVTDTSEAVDELTGKLLSFDKFEALNSSNGSSSSIDSVIEDMLASIDYSMITTGTVAAQLSEEWLNMLGFIDENGDGILDITEKAQDLLDTIKDIGIVIGTLLGIKLTQSIIKIGLSIGKWLISPTTILLVGIGLLVYGILSLVDAWDEMTGLQKVVTILSAVTAAFLTAALAIGVFHASWTLGIGAAAIVAGIALIIGSMNSVKNQINSGGIRRAATGGIMNEGQLFIANEAGAEMIGSMDGKTAVANNDQIVAGIRQGVYSAVLAANSQSRNKLSGNVYLDGTKVGKVVEGSVHSEGVRVGHFSK